MSPHVRLFVGRLACHEFLKGREVALPCFYHHQCKLYSMQSDAF